MQKTLLSRSIFFLCLMLIFTNTLPVQAQKLEAIKISGNFRNVPLESFLQTLEKDYGVQVFYKKSWVAPYTINTTFNENPLLRALNSIFLTHDLTFEVFQNNAILVYPRRMDTRTTFDASGGILVIGDPINLGKYRTGTITGKVIDGKTGDPLPGAVIYEPKLEKGASTNSEGKFTLDLPSGEHILKISYMGFQEYEQKIKLIESGEAEFELFEETHNLEEVIVVADEFNSSRTQTSLVQMTSKEIKNLPLLMGERDVIKSITMMPGITSVGELSSGFNVRGGNSDQNLILLDGSPVFNSTHLFGFLSMINPDLVEDLRVFKGGLPARYGERVSSVMEVDIKNGDSDILRVYGGIGTINSRLALDGPLTKDKKLTIAAGGRLSYSDWLLDLVPDPVVSESTTNFYDASGKLMYRFDKHNSLRLMAYISNDEFSTSSQSVNEYGNLLLNLQSRNKFTENLFGELNLSHSDYHFRLTDLADGKDYEAYYLDNNIRYDAVKYNLIWHPHPLHNTQTGFNLIRYENEPGEISAYSDTSIVVPQKIDPEKAFEGAVYASDEFDITPGLTLNAGLRYSLFALRGPSTVLIYDENQPKSPETVIDTREFGKNETVKSYGGLEPRISMNYDAENGYSFKLSYQRTRQYVNQISNSAVISPAEIWKTSDYHLEPLINDQITAGLTNNMLFTGIDFTVEAYYKQLQNLIEYKNGAQIIMNERLETDLIPADGYSYGLELSLNKKEGRLTGWLNYTYSRTMRETTGEFDDEQINNGDYYPSIYDKPHDLSAVATYNISRRWRVSSNFVFISGRPVTLPEMTYQYAGETLVYYSDRNKYRMEPYHRLDISLTFDENLRRKRMWKGSWTLSVYNVYGRNNPYSVYYRKASPGSGSRGNGLYKMSIIGVPVPSLTYNFKF
ncbi:carboxypeptidase-like regulatory domain-containing protein [Maribellus sediminis]|uniref:carboxypeptidase-like regulatory domain-containing protein n=1 Tax=Maribellus sediminis TaxID=2696285 RepID=UPI00142F7D71|nr:carboxypeptidase-like regulatory domain-containing protein [Maribellus sediminis]